METKEIYNDQYLKNLYLEVELCDYAIKNKHLIDADTLKTFVERKKVLLGYIEKREAMIRNGVLEREAEVAAETRAFLEELKKENKK